MQHFQRLRRTPLGPRVLTCVVIYQSNSRSRRSRVLRRSLVLLACAALSRSQTTPLGPRVFTCVIIYHSISTSRHSCVLRRSLFSLACTTLSRTSGDYAGPPGPHLCCNLPLQLNIPPFLRITEILAFVSLYTTSKDFGGLRRDPGSSLVV